MANILIIEDEAFLRNICARNLERKGHAVRTARDGEDGLAEIERQQPDLLLLDLLLPGVDGYTVLEFIQRRKYAFPIIVLSNIVWTFDREGCRKIGATEYFVKSNIDIPTLMKCIENHLPPQGTAR